MLVQSSLNLIQLICTFQKFNGNDSGGVRLRFLFEQHCIQESNDLSSHARIKRSVASW